MGWTAQGVDVLHRDHPGWMDRLAQLIEDYEVEALVVGLPRNMDGSIGTKGEACKQWGRELEERFQIPVKLWDDDCPPLQWKGP